MFILVTYSFDTVKQAYQLFVNYLWFNFITMPSLTVAKAKKEHIFSQIQSIFDLTKKTSDANILQQLLIRAKSINRLRQEFSDILDTCHELEIKADPAYTPNYSPLASVDELVDHINAVVLAIETKRQTKSKVENIPPPPPQQVNVRLPKLELKTFTGEPLEWVSFINLFNSSIHENTTLSAVIKFQYLLSVISGEPLNLVKSLPISENNYKVAYDLLKSRYHSPRRLVTLHINKILELPSINYRPTPMRLFVNAYNENMQALKALGTDIERKNPLLATILLKRMDDDLRKRFEHEHVQSRETSGDDDNTQVPEAADIIKFLNQECIEIEDASLSESIHVKAAQSSHPSLSQKYNKLKRDSFATYKNVSLLATPSTATNQKLVCFYCKKADHKIYSCPGFKNISPQERHKNVKDNKRCISCLGAHRLAECRSKASCITCHGKHHTLLHFTHRNAGTVNPSTPVPLSEPASPSISHATHNSSTLTCTSLNNHPPQADNTPTTVLLGTALVKLTAQNGTCHVFRALLDCGSMTDFVSERAAQLLGTHRLPSNVIVSGLSQTSAHTKGLLRLNVESLSGHMVAKLHSFHVLEKISIDIPQVQISQEVLNKVKPFTLADPTFHLSGPIDVLIGGALFPQILTQQSHALGLNMPHVLGTCFGFVIMGPCPCLLPTQSLTSISLLSTADVDLHSSLQRFWTQEELPPCSKKSAEEAQCDEFFNSTHSRDSDGRYVVRLPFKGDLSSLGSSKVGAEQRFQSLERKLYSSKNFEFQKLYTDFMHEYHSLGHMQECPTLVCDSPHYFLPHHGVLKDQSSTTKLRVVFDASAKTSSGLSLNDVLLTGPKLQNNICDILLRFRLHNTVFSCDIRQMYRQIKIHPDDQNFQLILWRDNPSQPTAMFKLTTVTYGMNCSPYLAIKTLHQLAEDEGDLYPRAAHVLKHQSYVDDLICGAEDEEDAAELQGQLIKLLRLGGFELRKWVSNSPHLLQHLPEDHREVPVFLQSTQEPHFSILGLKWSSSTDTFTFNLNFTSQNPTKRKVLSLIAQVYDPCGFLAPCIMLTKNIMQLLWTSGSSWDDPLPLDLAQKWNTFLIDLKNIVKIAIPRAIPHSTSVQWDLHGFCDASEKGYAAVVYIRSVTSDSTVQVNQVIAKTRVAPLQRVTLPRLELCAAHLLARLVNYCVNQMSFAHKFESIVLWCDSTVALAWLRTPSYRLKTYVANRVAQAQELVSPQCWRYIPSADNPADCASRGILPSQLVNHPLWWHGPDWLQFHPSTWPAQDTEFSPDPASVEEMRTAPLVSLLISTPPSWDLFTQYSSWRKLLHVTAYIMRYIHNCRHHPHHCGPLSRQELDAARLRIFKIVQVETFPEDLALLQNSKMCSTRLQRLSPFLDQDGLLRVGGRLRHADLPQDTSHPYILPKKHPVVDLYIDFFHIKYLHAGVQLTLSLLAQYVWILSARSVVKSRIFRCLICFRNKPKNTLPLMGDLPKARVTPARAFLSTGMDYGGPFTLKVHNMRSIRHIKAYMCIFICMVTKAVHIEVVTDLSTEAFLAALTRFVSRRGLCTDLYSDCGTNFVGAKNALQKVLLSSGRQKLQDFAASNSIRFHFNPPAAPHQGGIWESAIKSAKHHLRRVMGTHTLTISQFMTLTSQVEAVLNSRPLTALSNDPNDLQPLTPGHFLIGSPLVAIPEEDFLETPSNRLKHWQLVQALHQRFWKRWNREYLQTLQQRLKWSSPTRNLRPGDLVLVHQDTPPLSWPLARVTEVSSGQDGVVRVVRLKTQNTTLSRPAVKVFLLPCNED